MADLTVATVNVNGLRAAVFGRKNGSSMVKWFKLQKLDVLCLQETRISKEKNKKELARICTMLGIVAEDFHLQEDENDPSRHGGVAVWVNPKTCSVMPHETKDLGFSGRWQEILVKFNNKEIMIANCYYHSANEKKPETMENKHKFFAKTTRQMRELLSTHKNFILVGDINTMHKERIDIKAFATNQKKAGFLPEERAWLDLWFATNDTESKVAMDRYNKPRITTYRLPKTDQFSKGGLGLLDVVREKLGKEKEIYSFWSWKFNALENFKKNAGRRIDYQIASESMYKYVDKAPEIYGYGKVSHKERWSDHAPVVVTYSI